MYLRCTDIYLRMAISNYMCNLLYLNNISMHACVFPYLRLSIVHVTVLNPTMVWLEIFYVYVDSSFYL